MLLSAKSPKKKKKRKKRAVSHQPEFTFSWHTTQGCLEKGWFTVTTSFSKLSAAFSSSLWLLNNLLSVGGWLCWCVYSIPRLYFSTDPINPPIFRTFRSLWLLQTFGWPSGVCLCCGVASPQKNACNSGVPLIPFSTRSYARHAFFHLQPSPVCVCVIGFIPSVDHRQSNSTHSSP